MEYNYTKVSEIKVDSPLIGKVGFKQSAAPIVCFIFGVAILFVNSIYARILGVFFILMALFVLRFVQDKPTMDVYQKGAVLYNPKNTELGFYINYDDIVQWKVRREDGHDSIIFEFADKQKTGIDTFQIEKAYDYLMKAIPSKEERVIQHEKNKQMKFSNPIDTLKNLGKRFNKK